VQKPTIAQEAAPAGEPPHIPLYERLGNGALFGLAAFFGGTFLISLGTYFYQYNKVENRARRKVRHLR
jgi:hypothetical protein